MLVVGHQELIVCVGFPASGKSTLSKRYLVPAGYAHVNRDTLKTQDKCVKAASDALSNGKSVVIDNTNPSKETRASYIVLAKKAKVPVRCFLFDIKEELAHHLNYYRERLTNGEEKHVPRIGYNIYKKKFEPPTMAEGFAEIRSIKFVANFANKAEEELFNQKA